MAVPVPAGVVFSYNGYTFGPYIKTTVTEKPVAGSGDRTVKYSEITIKVDGWLTQADADAYALAQNPPLAAGLSLNFFLVALRRQLQRHGKPLAYLNKGYGWDLGINQPATSLSVTRDVAMGPRAGEFHFKPLGGAPDGCHGATFDWSVTTTIIECDRARYVNSPGNFTDMTFTVAYDTGEDGLVTITINGKAEIPLSLNATDGIDHQIDEYFAAAVAPVPVGFLRKMHRTLSADRRSCDFTITDRQIEIPYPSDIVEIDAKFKIKALTPAARRWTATLTAGIRLRPGATKGIAWLRFFSILQSRMESVINSTTAYTGVRTVTQPVIELEEDLFKNSSRFTATYFVIGLDLRNVLLSSGLWIPVADVGAQEVDFARWRGTLIGNAQATLGGIGAQFDKSQDVIIATCPNGSPIVVGGASYSTGTGDDDDWDDDWDALAATEPVNLPSPLAEGSASDGSPPPVLFAGPDDVTPSGSTGWGSKQVVNPLSSWLEWACSVRRIIDHKMIRHKPLSGSATTDIPQIDVTAKDSLAKVAADTSADSIGFQSTVPDIIQQIASPSITLELRGYAIRYGYTINAPKLISFGGVAAILAHEDVTPTTLGSPDGGSVYYRLDWVLTYIIPSPPATISVPANPYIGTDGQQ